MEGSSSSRGRGRGRGRGRLNADAVASALAEPKQEEPSSDDEVMADAPPAAGPSRPREALQVHGMLGSSEYGKRANTPKIKFVPNRTRKTKVVKDEDDDDSDVKMSDGDLPWGKGRGRGRGRGRGERVRQELEMTASGPMAQGPGGAPRDFGARSFGGNGVAVMNAARHGGASGSRGGGGSGRFADAPEDPDASDLEPDSDDGTLKVRARDLNDIGDEDEMAPLVLPRDPKVVRGAKERRKARVDERVKMETDAAVPLVKAEPDDDAASSLLLSATATPALEIESKADTLDSKEDIEEQKVKLEQDLRDDFDVTDPNRERLYIFQFPRKFPKLVNELNADPSNPPIKPEPGSAAATARAKIPPDWGRMGARANKSARWSTEEGQIGELFVHKSGKVTMKINGDLTYEVLPAAQPSFLQEVVILNHDPANEPLNPGQERPESDPSNAILMMGQTSKKFIVVPDALHLLEKIQEQEKAEKEEAKRKLAVKKEEPK